MNVENFIWAELNQCTKDQKSEYVHSRYYKVAHKFKPRHEMKVIITKA